MLSTIKEKIINQKQKHRNTKQINTSKENKENTLSKKPKKERIDLVGPRTIEFLYNLEKRKKLNSMKEKSHKITGFMNTLGQSFKSFNRNLNSEINPLMMKNLTNISFRRSLFIRQKLRNIDKMNKEFDKEYLNPMDLNAKNYDANNKDINDASEKYKERIKKEIKLRNAHFRTESMKILNLLYKKNRHGICFSDYKKNKKLNELKNNIDFICGNDIIGKNGNKQKDPKKVSHYTEQTKSPSFIREKTKNVMFTPSVKYNKTKVIYNKKYELSQEKIDKSKKYSESLSSPIHISPSKKIKIKIKGRNYLYKTEPNKNNLSKFVNSMSGSKETNKDNSNKSISPTSNTIENNNIYNQILPELSKKKDDESIYKTGFNSRKNIYSTFSPKQRHISLEQNLTLNRKYDFSPEYRCKTANNITLYKNRPKGQKFYPLLKNLLKDNYNLKHDLKFGFNIINNMINDYKKCQKKRIPKTEVDIEKIRKELKLNNSNNNIIDEIDIVMNNVKKMEKLIKKKDVYFLRKVAKTVLREDMLTNKNILFDNSLNAKLKRLGDRKKKGINQEEKEVNLNQQERVEMIRLFKNDGPDFFNEDYLSSLIKRYKTLNVK